MEMWAHEKYCSSCYCSDTDWLIHWSSTSSYTATLLQVAAWLLHSNSVVTLKKQHSYLWIVVPAQPTPTGTVNFSSFSTSNRVEILNVKLFMNFKAFFGIKILVLNLKRFSNVEKKIDEILPLLCFFDMKISMFFIGHQKNCARFEYSYSKIGYCDMGYDINLGVSAGSLFHI